MIDLSIEGSYISGQVNKQKYLEYYKAVLHYLEFINGIMHIQDELTIAEYKIAIDTLLED